eukprot:7587865-Karenia_brevis.AAC.1
MYTVTARVCGPSLSVPSAHSWELPPPRPPSQPQTPHGSPRRSATSLPWVMGGCCTPAHPRHRKLQASIAMQLCKCPAKWMMEMKLGKWNPTQEMSGWMMTLSPCPNQ